MKKPKTLKDLQNDQRVDSIHSEYENGTRKSWWCYLKQGWINVEMECGTIHENTIKEVCDRVHNTEQINPKQ